SIESVVDFQNGLCALDLRRFPHRFAIHQQLQVIGPHSSRPCQEHSEEKLAGLGMDRERNRVLSPARSALDPAALHVVESQRSGFAILTHPKAGKAADVLRTEKTAKLNGLAGKIHCDGPVQSGEGAWRIRLALKSRRPVAAMNDLALGENCSR